MTDQQPPTNAPNPSPKRQAASWDSIRNITAVAASVLVVAAGLIGVGAWAQYHFAGQQTVEDATCRVAYDVELLGLQMRAANAYTRYVNAKVNKSNAEIQLEGDSPTDDQIAAIATQEERMRHSWDELQKAKAEGDSLTKRFESGQLCPEKGGVLWPAS